MQEKPSERDCDTYENDNDKRRIRWGGALTASFTSADRGEVDS